MEQRDVQSPFGTLSLKSDDDHLVRVTWTATGQRSDTPVLKEAEEQLRAYFEDPATQFDLPLRVDASAFQKSVCDAMRAIPTGETCTYGDIANALGVTAQAVGQACGANPIPIIIPCHRVMGAGGKLTGFSGGTGVETKVALLRHEAAGGFLI